MNNNGGDATGTSTRRRLVVFVGPHKSASSTVQEFLVQYATGRPKYRKLKAFQDWRWPMLRKSRIPARKQWARLVYRQDVNGTDPADRKAQDLTSLRKDLKATLQELYQAGFDNVAVGSEELDRFGKTPWSHRDGIGAMLTLIEWAQQATVDSTSKSPSPLQVDFVLNYRTPRQAQWISIWKQLMSLEESLFHRPTMAYPQWICQSSDQAHLETYHKVWEYLDCVSNPLGLTEAMISSLLKAYPPGELSQHGISWKVSILDMGGIQRQQLDIAHVSACDIMKVPCTGGWVRGINRTLLVNPKSRDLEGVTSQQLQEMEWLLQQRDCTYQSKLTGSTEGTTSFEILYKDSLWNDCPPIGLQNLPPVDFSDTTVLLELLKSQFGCHSMNLQHNLTDLVRKSSSGTRPVQAVESQSSKSTSSVRQTSTSEVPQDYWWIQSMQWVLAVALFTALLRIRLKGKSRKHSPR